MMIIKDGSLDSQVKKKKKWVTQHNLEFNYKWMELLHEVGLVIINVNALGIVINF